MTYHLLEDDSFVAFVREENMPPRRAKKRPPMPPEQLREALGMDDEEYARMLAEEVKPCRS